MQAALKSPQTTKNSQVHKNISTRNEVATPSSSTVQEIEKPKPGPAQEKTSAMISEIEKELMGLLVVENSGLSTPDISSRKRKLEENLKKEQRNLKKLEDSRVRMKNYRLNKRTKLKELCQEIPAAGAILNLRQKSGRPRIEEDQPDLLQVIVKIATLGSGAHLRRRDETLRCCKTLDELHEQLKDIGYQISRSATYLRLLPHLSYSTEGRRHVKTVPVKLVRAQTSEHKSHEDSTFCTTTIMSLNSLASFLGNNFNYNQIKNFFCINCKEYVTKI